MSELRDMCSAEGFGKVQTYIASGNVIFRDERPESEIKAALDIDPFVPVQLCDVRDRESNKRLLVLLMEHIMSTAQLARAVVPKQPRPQDAVT
jgi:hypothetical protein